MKIRDSLAIVSVALLTACASEPAVRVSDAEGVESVSAIAMSCKKPFGLTKDCSNLSGPTKKISLGGHPVRVAGNEDDTITVLFGKNSSKATETSNLGYELVKRELVKRGYEIIQVTPIESAGLMFGYAVQTTEPSYQIWGEYAAE